MAKKTSTNNGDFDRLIKKLTASNAKDKASDFLYEYFFKAKIFNGKFLEYLVVNHPLQFIDAVRKSQAFLRVGKLKQLLHLEDCDNVYIRNYIRVFKVLSQEEQRQYSKIEDLLKVFDQTNPVAVLNVVCFWFESKRAEVFFNNRSCGITYEITPTIETVNFFLTHYFKAVNTEEELQKASSASIASYTFTLLDSHFTKHPAWQILDLIDSYLFFLKGTIEAFSSDSNYGLNVSGNIATLSFQNLNLREKWNEEEAKMLYRYRILKQRAEIKSLNELGLTDQDLENNPDSSVLLDFSSKVKLNLSLAAAEDFYLTNSVLDGVPTNILINYLSQNIIESYSNYIFPMDLKNSVAPELWRDHLRDNILELENTDQGGCPLIILGQEMVKKVQEFYALDSITAIKLVDLISNDISSYEYADRFHSKINLLGKPLIKVGNIFIGFRPITGEAVNHLNALINIMHCNHDLHQANEQKEVQIMEYSVMKIFRCAGFNNTDCSVEIIDNGIIKGEFDLLVYENGVLLIVEIKRSKPRVFQSDVNNELLNSLNVASIQLDARLEYIENSFDDFKAKCSDKLKLTENSFTDLKIISLILSTSLEQDHTFIRDKYLKISLFELKEVLSSFKQNFNRNSIEHLYSLFVSNEFWQTKDLHYEIPGISDRMIKFKL